ncbi:MULTISPECIES: type II toxin-antitoxin system RelE/ParE family toxin [unclassified Caulobacter]|uniref:type II toxin-antitoxin system RelE/ParE family toxin n=1 Tax=unclassified Caulobacter TaxID=2648921 RepID=UPI000D37B628|nr:MULTISPECIES: type II toxin-antitoxin system RelE/ParE family toxin [unclassified Caulobacter]PTS84548.1 plasmid stabilization protein ParE [Caulobacter sp. HMWF009]PTT11815.1 plasmid stabilization protein ParE [Caulobacter sp. HMWF025]
MAYRLSRKAEADIIDLYLIGADAFGEAQAERYHAGLEQAFAFLSDFPRAAPEREGLGRSSRVHPYKSHIIIYRLDGADILIQRVRHAHEDWMS